MNVTIAVEAVPPSPYDVREVRLMSEAGKRGGAKGRRGVVVDLAQKRASAEEAAAKQRARELARARDVIDASDETRAARVEELKRQVERGEYHPDPREVAREILERGL